MKLRHKLLIPFYLLTLHSLVYAQPNNTQLNITFESTPFELSRPFVTTQIQNKELRMLFDTGFSTADIGLSKEMMESISVNWLDQKTCSENAFGNKKCFDTFQIQELTLGSLTLKNIKGVLLDEETLNAMFSDEDHAQVGVIGLPLISQFEVLLNYPENNIVLSHGTPLNTNNLTEQARLLFDEANIIQTNFPINGHQARLVWDTGAISIISAQFGNDLEKKACPVIMDDSIPCVENDAINTTTTPLLPKSWFYLMPLPDDLKLDGFIGSQFFHQYPVKIDFTKHEIVLYR